MDSGAGEAVRGGQTPSPGPSAGGRVAFQLRKLLTHDSASRLTAFPSSRRPVNVKTEISGNFVEAFHALSELPLATEEPNEGWGWWPELPLSAGSAAHH